MNIQIFQDFGVWFGFVLFFSTTKFSSLAEGIQKYLILQSLSIPISGAQLHYSNVHRPSLSFGIPLNYYITVEITRK